MLRALQIFVVAASLLAGGLARAQECIDCWTSKCPQMKPYVKACQAAQPPAKPAGKPPAKPADRPADKPADEPRTASPTSTFSGLPMVFKASTQSYSWQTLRANWEAACGAKFHVCTFLEASSLWAFAKYHAGSRASVTGAPGGHLWTAGDFNGNVDNCKRNFVTHSSAECWGPSNLDALLCPAGTHPGLFNPQKLNAHVTAGGSCVPDVEVHAAACCADGADL